MKNYWIIAFCIVISVLCLFQLYRRRDQDYWKPEQAEEMTVVPDTCHCVLYTSYNVSYKDKPFVKLNAEILGEYANLHGHTYKQIIHRDNFMSPYWTRVYDLVNILNSSSENSLVMYFDADAVPKSQVKHISISRFINSVKNKRGDFFVSEDPNVKYDVFYKGVFNSGVFIVRNNAKMRALANRWMSMYNKDHQWVRKDNKWKCKIYDRNCLWSFKGYEQYALTELYLESPELFTRLHWSTLACNKDSHKNCFVVHLMGHDDEQREKIFRKILTEYRTYKTIN